MQRTSTATRKKQMQMRSVHTHTIERTSYAENNNNSNMTHGIVHSLIVVQYWFILVGRSPYAISNFDFNRCKIKKRLKKAGHLLCVWVLCSSECRIHNYIYSNFSKTYFFSRFGGTETYITKISEEHYALFAFFLEFGSSNLMIVWDPNFSSRIVSHRPIFFSFITMEK